MLERLGAIVAGATVGGGLPLAAAETLAGNAIPSWFSIGISAAFGAVGALGALYAFAPTRRECALTHHNENNKINAAALSAQAAGAAGAALRNEFVEFRGEVRSELKSQTVTLNRIADHLGVMK